MKKCFLVLLTFIICSIQSCTNAPVIEKSNEAKDVTKSSSGKLNVNRISTSDVPPAVISTFKTKYPAAADVEWETATEDRGTSV